MNGPAAAALAAAAEAAAGSFRTSKRWTSRLGSPAMAGLAMYACGTLYMFGVEFVSVRIGAQSLMTRLLLLFPIALAYFAAGTLLMASLITLKQSSRCNLGNPAQSLVDGARQSRERGAGGAVVCRIHTLGAGVFLAALR